jgi:WD40 repeat protein
VAFSKDGDYLVGGNSSGHIYLWDVATQQITAQFQDPATQGIRAMAFDPNGQFAALDANGHIYLYGHSIAATFPAPGAMSLAFSKDGDYLADANPNSQASLCRINST